jgi:predicted enzyme related to lactoylglutathione lyase
MVKQEASAFAWMVINTSDPHGAASFYQRLFGWNTHDSPVGRLLTTRTGRPVGTLLDHRQNTFAKKEPVNWLPFVRVTNVDSVIERVRQLGGKVWIEPYDVGIARVALIRGVTREVIGLWQTPLDPSGSPLFTDPDAFGWLELVTPEPERAVAFYRGVFGWRIGDEGGYTFVGNSNGQFAGIVKLEGDWEDYAFMQALGRAKGGKLNVPPHWMVFFTVDDCEAFVDEAEALGAYVMSRAEPLHTVGTFAVLRDPQGVYFSVLSKK